MTSRTGRDIELALSIGACFVAGLGCGTMYLYSAYAPQLAAELELNATSSSIVGIIGNLGMALTGPVAGVLVDKKGPTIPLIIGAVVIFTGYFVIRNSFASHLSSVPVLATALLMVGSGSTFCFAALVKCAALNFPASRGLATSVPMAAFGLSAMLFSSIGSLVAPGDTYGLLQILSFLPACLFVFTIPFVRFLPPQTTISVGNRSEPGEKPSVAAPPSEKNDPYGDSGLDIHGTRLLRSRQFWLNFAVMGLIGGISQMYIYSCGYCVRALAAGSADAAQIQHFQALQVSAISLTSFGGRLASGFLSDYIRVHYGLPRKMLLLGAGIVSLFAQLLALSVSSSSYLWLVSGATGFAYGICYGTYPTIIGDTFGMRHFSQNWGLLSLSPVPVSYLLNMLFGVMYDANSTVDETGHRVCALGRECYSKPFTVTTLGTCVLCFVLIPLMLRRSH